jgi:hypothetical protein
MIQGIWKNVEKLLVFVIWEVVVYRYGNIVVEIYIVVSTDMG